MAMEIKWTWVRVSTYCAKNRLKVIGNIIFNKENNFNKNSYWLKWDNISFPYFLLKIPEIFTTKKAWEMLDF